MENENVLFNVKGQKRQVKQKRHPIPIDKEQESQKAMNRSFRDNVRVETVAKIDRVNVITILPHLLANRTHRDTRRKRQRIGRG
jgi:hypothetical protein